MDPVKVALSFASAIIPLKATNPAVAEDFPGDKISLQQGKNLC